MHQPFHLRRAGIALVGAALLLAGAAGANAAGGPQPGTAYKLPSSPNRAAALSEALLPTPGSDLQFVSVPPCRILDTRFAGGVLSGQRDFDATLATYASQGGKAGTCNIPDIAMAVQLNVGAISVNGKSSWLTAWAAGSDQPTASILNFDPSGPVANMVTMPLNVLGEFTLRTPATAHVFADVAGYYVQPLYATIDAQTDPLAPAIRVGSGVVSVETYKVNDLVEPGQYTVTFDRDVTQCVPTATDFWFADSHFFSADAEFRGLFEGQPNQILVQIKDVDGDPSGSMFNVSLTC